MAKLNNKNNQTSNRGGKSSNGRSNYRGNKNTSRSNKDKNSNVKNTEGQEGNYDREDPSNQDGHNDVSWYAKNPQLLKDVASLAYVWPAGLPFRYVDASKASGDQNGRKVAPGICSVRLLPSLPETSSANGAINVAGVKELSFLKHTVSSKLPYDSPELICMLYAMANVYGYINFLRRAYAAAWLMVNENRNTPDGILELMGINPSVRGDLAAFRAKINMLTAKVSALAVPKDISIFYRTAFLYANFYTGGTSVKDQLYLYNPAGFFRYSETNPDVPGAHLELDIFSYVDYEAGHAPLLSAQGLYTYGESLLAPLLASEDVGVISANILRAYGSNGILKVEPLTEDFRLVPIFNIGVLEQMSNAEVLSPKIAQKLVSNGSWDVTQVLDDNNVSMYLKFQPQFTNLTDVDESLAAQLHAHAAIKHVLTTTTGFTDPGVNIESTRLKYTTHYQEFTDPAKGPMCYLSCGTETCVGAEYFTLDYSDPGGKGYRIERLSQFAMIPQTTLSFTYQDYMDFVSTVSDLAYFRFHPQVVALPYGVEDTVKKLYTFGNLYTLYDIDNFTLIDSDQLDAMNEVATLSLFDAPGVASAY